jgi:hypothetical protein
MGSKTLPTIWGTYMKLVTKYQISAINSCWEKCDEKWAYMFNVCQKSDIWSQASYRYPISWEAFLNPSDSYFLFADFVDFSTHWTYMLIFRRIFLSNYWWQKSDIWSQASYRYPISFLGPSDSYFLFAKERGYHVPIWSLWPNIRFLPSIVAEKNVTKNEHICSMCRKINKVGKQEVGIRWVQKHFPRYGVPIWSLWPNIRFLPSIVAEKNLTKNVHICSMCIKTN